MCTDCRAMVPRKPKNCYLLGTKSITAHFWNILFLFFLISFLIQLVKILNICIFNIVNILVSYLLLTYLTYLGKLSMFNSCTDRVSQYR